LVVWLLFFFWGGGGSFVSRIPLVGF